MPSTTDKFTLAAPCSTDEKMVDFNQDFVAAGSSDPLRLRQSDSEVTFQISGSATAFSAWVERSTRDPLREVPNWAPADSEIWEGNLSSGQPPRMYHEPGRGWWRLRIVSLSGGNLQLNIIGEQA